MGRKRTKNLPKIRLVLFDSVQKPLNTARQTGVKIKKIFAV